MLRTHLFQTLSSKYYDQALFYSNFTSDIRGCKKELVIESAFLTAKRVNTFLPILRKLVYEGVNVIVNTRNPNEHEGFMCDQSVASVHALQRAGVTVLYTTGLHRKLAVIDCRIVWEGSLNILSQSDSCEIMKRTVSTKVAKELLTFLQIY